MRKLYIYIALILLISVGFVFLLQALTDKNTGNGFKRKTLGTFTEIKEIIPKKNNKVDHIIKTSVEEKKIGDQAHMISPNSLIIREPILHNGNLTRAISKFDINRDTILLSSFILPRQVDGLFCTDGTMQYDTVNAKIFYMYAYRGEIVCLDTNLNKLNSIKTIDTVSQAKIHLAPNSPSQKIKKLTQITPPFRVNNSFNVFEGCIYLHSALRAENESSTHFKDNMVIDVYDIAMQKYLGSIYLPKYKDLKPGHFIIKKESITVIFKGYQVTYKYNPNYSHATFF